ncbi:MAG: ankyrin repeat domain-containing protein [Vicinamibacterales bacterium]
MSTDSNETPRPLPARPNLRHLKDQAKDLVKSGAAASLSEAQFIIARQYGFASWPKLQAHVALHEEFNAARDANDVTRMRAMVNAHVSELMSSGAATSVAEARAQVALLAQVKDWAEIEEGLRSLEARGPIALTSSEVRQLCRAIEAQDVPRVQQLMTRQPGLHRAPIGYGKNGPLTFVAECDVPPSAASLSLARWMIEHGSDVHQGGDGPLMRAALVGGRIPMMDLLVSLGADVNARWDGWFPIIFAACEGVDSASLTWLLDHGANPNAADREGTSALDYVIGTYVRSPDLATCIDLLSAAGGVTKYARPGVLELLCGRLDRLAALIAADPVLTSTRFDELDFGATGGRMLTLKGATLLHVAAEYRHLDAIHLLLGRGADVNGRASIDEAGVGGQTAIFHAVTQADDGGVAATRLLADRGADLAVRAKLPGHYERQGEIVECTPLGYALRFQETRSDKGMTVALLRERGAPA